jgi:phosphoserine phosphatase
MFLIYLIDNQAINSEIINIFQTKFSATIDNHKTELSKQKSINYNLGYHTIVITTTQQPNKTELYKLAQQYNIDAFFINDEFKIDDIKIIAMDMDSTLINIECIDEIADLAGVKEQVSQITRETMQGKIKDFSESLRRRVAFLKDIKLSLLDDIYNNRLKLSHGAESMLNYAHDKKIYTMLLSGGFTFFSDKLKNRLNLNQAQSNQLGIKEGLLTGEVEGLIVDGIQKANFLQQAILQQNINSKYSIAIGDGANDLPMMTVAGFSIAYKAKPIVAEQASISIKKGGLDILILLP